MDQPAQPDFIRQYTNELSKAHKKRFLFLRQLIFTTAAETPGVGSLEETLKWGQPAYLTAKSKSGTTLRLATHKLYPQHVALYVHCQTSLISEFQTAFPKTLQSDKSRALLIPVGEPIQRQAIGFFIHIALTYHLNKRK